MRLSLGSALLLLGATLGGCAPDPALPEATPQSPVVPSAPGGGTPVCVEGPCPEPGGGGGAGGPGGGGGSGAVPAPTSSDPAAQPVDPGCALGQATATQPVLVPKWAPLPPTVPADCLQGFEMNRLESYVHTMSSPQGSRAITLEIDIATYTAPDSIRISALDASGQATVLVDTCRLRTAEYADPTGGKVRPPEDSIRDFRVALPAGTRALKLDHAQADTPTYVRILGLCDFAVQAPPTTVLPATHFRAVSSR